MVDGGEDDVEMVLDDSANAASENVTNVSNELAGVVQTKDATETDTNTSDEDPGVTNSNTTADAEEIASMSLAACFACASTSGKT